MQDELMIYVMSDLQGYYQEYLETLNKINFNKNDILYILGNVIDRGQYHIDILKKLNVEITAENAESYIDEKTMLAYIDWIQKGGQTAIIKQRKKYFKLFSRFFIV